MSPAGAGRRPRESAAADANSTAIDLLTDFAREQIALAMETSGAWLRGFEAMRAAQRHAARAASVRHRAAARALRTASAPADLFIVPMSLWQGDLQAAGRSWEELLGSLLETQTEWLGGACSHWFDSATALESASAVETLDAAAAAALPRRRPPRRARAGH